MEPTPVVETNYGEQANAILGERKMIFVELGNVRKRVALLIERIQGIKSEDKEDVRMICLHDKVQLAGIIPALELLDGKIARAIRGEE